MDILAPLPDFVDSSAVFTDTDLKQQVHNISIALDVLHEVGRHALASKQWVEMWRGHEVMLAEYGITLAEEYISRETADDSKTDIVADLKNIEWHMENATTGGDFSMDKPAWWGNALVHDSHAAILLRRNREAYKIHFDVDTSVRPYFPTE